MRILLIEVNLNTIENFKIRIPYGLLTKDRDKLQLVLFSYNINWISTSQNLQNFVYVKDRHIYHCDSIHEPWDHFPSIDYKELLDGY